MILRGVARRRVLLALSALIAGELLAGSVVLATSRSRPDFRPPAVAADQGGNAPAPAEKAGSASAGSPAPAGAPAAPARGSSGPRLPKLAGPRIDTTKGLPLEVSVQPKCATRGQAVHVLVKTLPGTKLGMIVAYSNAKNFGEYYVGPVGEDGTLRWSFIVHPAAPSGQGRLLVSAARGEKDSAEAEVPFEVAGVEGC